MNSNFLNAQNYILGKTEKKKLLSKFFVEKFLKVFYGILSWFYSYFGLIIVILFLSLLLFSGFIFLLNEKSISNKISIIFSIFIFLFMFFYLTTSIKIKKIKINSIKKILLTRKNLKNYINIIFYVFFVFIFILFFNVIVDFYIIIKILITFFLIFLFKYLNFYSLLLFPFFLIIIFFITIYSLIYTFIFKGTEGYKFLKYKPQTKFFTKFKKLKKNFAKNEFYLVEVKK